MFLDNSSINCSISRSCFSRDLVINFGRRRIVYEFRIYVISCLCEFLIHISYISFGFQRSLIRFLCQFVVHICRIRFATHGSCKIIQLAIQLVDVRCIRSDVRCILNNLGLICFGVKCCFIRFFVQQCIHSRRGIYLRSGARRKRRIHMHSDICRTRYAQSSAEERKRHKRREKGTFSHPPNFFRAGSRLGMSPSDFRRYHIAVLCLGPDDFVDVIHDDFPLCEKQ